MKLYEQYQGRSGVLTTTQRSKVTLNNARRNAMLRVTIRGQVDVAGAPTGAAVNGGSIAAAVSLALTENGNDTFRMLPALLYRAISAYDSNADLSGARLASASAIGTYQLYETFTIPFAMRAQARAAETAYIESNRTAPLELQAILNPGAAASIVVAGGAAVTLSNVTVEATQVYSRLEDGTELPIWRPGLEVLTLPVAGASASLPMDVKISDRVTHFVVAGFGTNAGGGSVVSAAGDIVRALALYGSNGAQDLIVGPSQTPYQELIDSMTIDGGGSTQLTEGIYVRSFINQGLLSDTIRPDAFANLRFYFDTAPGAGLTNSQIVVLARTLTAPPPFAGWRAVSGQLPEWAG